MSILTIIDYYLKKCFNDKSIAYVTNRAIDELEDSNDQAVNSGTARSHPVD